MKNPRICWLALLLFLASGPALAHKPSDSYLTLTAKPGQQQVEGQWDIALRDLEYAVGVDTNGDGDITWGELRSREEAVTNYALTHLQIATSGQQCPLKANGLLVDEHVDGHYAVIRFEASCASIPVTLDVKYSLLFAVDPSHHGLLQIDYGGITQAIVFSSNHPEASISLAKPDHWQEAKEFISDGIWHIWTGYDHILFLLTLLFPAVLVRAGGSWQPRTDLKSSLLDVLGVVTAFTLAHSVTLSLAVLGVIHLPSRVVESGIALTVFFGALNNLYPVVTTRRWLVAFTFGLIHGLGFASVLKDLGLHSWTLVTALFSFNFGVEIGQAAIVAVFVPLTYILRRTVFYRRLCMPAGSLLIAGIAAYWFLIRVFGSTFV